jgi:hypothetical protein
MADLQLTIDCQARHISLRTPRRFWIFGETMPRIKSANYRSE